MDAVVPRRGGHEDRRVTHLRGRTDVLVWRIRAQEVVPVGGVRVAVFGHPRRPGEQQVIALHVQQRHRDRQRTEQLRIPGEHDAHEKATVRAARGPQLIAGGHAGLDESAGYCREILVRAGPLLPDGGLMPRGPVLATTANSRHHVDATLLEPQRAPQRGVRRPHRHHEPAVAVQDRGPRAGRAPAAHDRVRHLRPVIAHGGVPGDLHPGGVETVRRRAERDGGPVGAQQDERRRDDRPGHRQHRIVRMRMRRRVTGEVDETGVAVE